MKTRQGSLRELNQKLTTTLHELEISNNLNKKLLQEREESELEIQDIVGRNSQLKSKLVKTKKELVELREQQERLVECHNQCNSLLNAGFEQIKEQQYQQLELKVTIKSLQDEIKEKELTQTAKLYDTLITSNDAKPLLKIDHSSFHGNIYGNGNEETTQLLAKRRIKKRKYLKLKRLLLHRNKKTIQQKNLSKINFGLIKDKKILIEEINNYKEIVKDYENEYVDHLEKIFELEAELEIIGSKYTLSQTELRENIATIDELLVVSSYNLRLAESRAAKQLDNEESMISQDSDQLLSSTLPDRGSQAIVTEGSPPLSQPCSSKTESQCNSTTGKTIKMFCDDIGRGMGYVVSTNVGSPIINNCLPNISYSQIVNKAVNEKHTKDDDIVIMVGDSSSVTRTDITSSIKTLLYLHDSGTVNKIIICTLPYSRSLSTEENKRIHALNLILYNLIASNCNKGQILLFDINIYIHNFVLTLKRQFLPNREKIVIAQLLTYVLQSDFPKCDYGLIDIQALN